MKRSAAGKQPNKAFVHHGSLYFLTAALVVSVSVWAAKALLPGQRLADLSGPVLLLLAGLVPLIIAVGRAHAQLLAPTFNWYIRANTIGSVGTSAPSLFTSGWTTFFLGQCLTQPAWQLLGQPIPLIHWSGYAAWTYAGVLLVLFAPIVETALLILSCRLLVAIGLREIRVPVVTAAIWAVFHLPLGPTAAIPGFLVFLVGATLYMSLRGKQRRWQLLVSVATPHIINNALGLALLFARAATQQ